MKGLSSAVFKTFRNVRKITSLCSLNEAPSVKNKVAKKAPEMLCISGAELRINRKMVAYSPSTSDSSCAAGASRARIDREIFFFSSSTAMISASTS